MYSPYIYATINPRPLALTVSEAMTVFHLIQRGMYDFAWRILKERPPRMPWFLRRKTYARAFFLSLYPDAILFENLRTMLDTNNKADILQLRQKCMISCNVELSDNNAVAVDKTMAALVAYRIQRI